MGREARYEVPTSTFTEATAAADFKHYPTVRYAHSHPLGGLLQYVQGATDKITSRFSSGVEVSGDTLPAAVHRATNGTPRSPERKPSARPLARGPENQRDCLLGRPSRGRPPHISAIPLAQQQALAQLGPIFSATTPLPPPKRDLLGHVTEQPHRDGSTEYFHRDAEGNVTAHLDTNNQWWQRKIVSWNLLGAEKSPSGAVIQYAYNHRELGRTWVDANGNRSDYFFDLAQQLVEMRHDGAASKRLKRDIGGAIVEVQSSDGNLLVKNEIGRHGLRTTTTVLDGEKYAFDYDAFGTARRPNSSKPQRKLASDFFTCSCSLSSSDASPRTGTTHQPLRPHRLLERFCIAYSSYGMELRVFTPGGAVHDFYTGRRITGRAMEMERSRHGFDADDRLWPSVTSPNAPWTLPLGSLSLHSAVVLEAYDTIVARSLGYDTAAVRRPNRRPRVRDTLRPGGHLTRTPASRLEAGRKSPGVSDSERSSTRLFALASSPATTADTTYTTTACHPQSQFSDTKRSAGSYDGGETPLRD